MQLVRFLKDMQLCNVASHQNSKLDSLRLGLTFQIENTLSCRRVWKVDLWNIYKNKISQDLCSAVTVNKHTIMDQKKLFFWRNFHFWHWLLKYSVVLISTSLTWCSILYFFLFIVHHLSTFKHCFCFKHHMQFSYIQCSVLIVFLF